MHSAAVDLRMFVDLMLGQCDRDPEAPHYTESTFRRKLIEAKKRDARLPSRQVDPSDEYLVRREWTEIVRDANLTQSQFAVFELRAQGWTFEEIGLSRGHSKQGAQSIFVQALKKVLLSRERLEFVGIAEIYREETRRRGNPHRRMVGKLIR